MHTRHFAILPVLVLLWASGCRQQAEPPVTPPGAPESARTGLLEAGATLLQADGPVGKLDIHLVGFHPMKDDPGHQMEAHHFCRQVNEDFAQCALFDGGGVQANLNGVEYIISERLFARLPAEERRYWHPHNAEILSGQLVAPAIPEIAETELMRSKMNSYGKTWHTWPSRHGTAPGEALPLGPALLAWSFNRDGEAEPGLVEARDRAMGISTAQVRERRAGLVDLARPQSGVDALHGRFEGPTREIPGVVDAGEAPSATAAPLTNGQDDRGR